MFEGNPEMDFLPMQVEAKLHVLLVASCYRNWNKCWPNGPLGTYADFTSTSELPFASF